MFCFYALASDISDKAAMKTKALHAFMMGYVDIVCYV